MIGLLLCALGFHEWWPRSTWPLALTDIASPYRARLNDCTAVCGRCPAKRYR